MTLLGLAAIKPEPEAEEPAQKQQRPGIHSVLMGAGGGAGIAFAIVELLHGDPHEWTQLLEHWGPWFLAVIIASYFAYSFVMQFSVSLLQLFGRFVGHVGTLASSSAATAIAIREIAEKDDRQFDQLLTLTTYGNNRAGQVLEKMEAHDAKFDALQKQVSVLAEQKKSA